MLAHQIEQHQTILIVDSLPEVVADRMCMNQIIGNILANAVAYLDPERPGKIEISGQRDFQETLFKVRDNGRGIAAEDMPKVFEPFRRAGQQDVLGEGMGLAYVQTLVRRHGGQIWCESEKGVGTTFSFTIANALDQNNPQQYERREDV
jgi:signal transduction histidine kinase